MKTFKTIPILAAILLCGTAIAAADPAYVIVDSSERHVTVYTALPKDMARVDLEQLKSRLSARPNAYLIEWNAFRIDLKRHVQANILKDEYPEINTAEGVVALLERYEKTPFGLTWNGGVAVTYNDYQHARRTYQKHLADPAFVARPVDRRRDPVHPNNHLGPLLGR